MKRALRTLTDRAALEEEMDDEMRHHVELETESLIRDGLTPREARRQAAISFGGVAQQKEQSIDESGVAWLIHLKRDLRIALRSLRRYPTFAITATLALSLAIAVNTSMFSILDAMINPEIGARDPGNVYEIKYFGDVKEKVDFQERRAALAAATRMFGQVTQYSSRHASLERGASYQDGTIAVARANFFEFMGIPPLMGTVAPAPDETSLAGSIVISDRLAGAFYKTGESPVGTRIEVGGSQLTVIGVVRRSSGMDALDHDAWTFAPDGQDLYGLQLIRLTNGITFEQAQEKLKVLAAQLAMAAGDPTRDSRFYVKPFVQQFHADRFHYALVGAGIAILLVACTNLANLQLARGLGRSGELALRASLGASRRQIVTQLLIESGVLAVGALFLSLLLTIAGNALVRATVPSSLGQYVVEPHSSWRMVVFACVAAVICVLVIGLVPALRISRVDLNTVLKSRAGTGAHAPNRRVYGMLVIVQIAFTLPLVCAAVLTTRAAMNAWSPEFVVSEVFGYDPRPIITGPLRVAVDTTKPVPIAELASTFIERARAVAGVDNAAVIWSAETAAITTDVPGGGTRELQTPMWGYAIVSPGFLRTMGLPMVEGQDFREGAHDQGGLIIDRETANKLWPGQPAVGRLIKFGDARSDSPFLRVQGVVGTLLSADAQDKRNGSRQTRLGMVYRVMGPNDSLPRSKYPIRNIVLTVRATHEPQRVAIALRHGLSAGTLIPPHFTPQDEYYERQRIVTRFVAGLFTTFGILALGLSAIGVYAIVAQSVQDRKREVAVRMSLGAGPKQILHALLREGNVLVLAGVAAGLLMAKQTISWLGMFLGDGVDLTNAPLFAAICALLFAMMVFSALVPAWRATKLDPMDVLRAE